MNDAERLSQDPTFRLIGSEKLWDRGAALTSRLQTFETEMLAEEKNFTGLARINRELIGKVEAFDWHYRAVLDLDSTDIPVYGEQAQSAYNGHFESNCYHPLLLFNREGDCLAAQLRPGNVHSAEGRGVIASGRIELLVVTTENSVPKPLRHVAVSEESGFGSGGQGSRGLLEGRF